MKSLKTLLIGTRDQGQATGISQMFEVLIHGFEKANIPFEVVDLTLGTPTQKTSSFSLKRAVRLLGALANVWFKLPNTKTVYLTVGVSLLGFLRDCAILWPAFSLKRSTIIHVHSGGYGEFYYAQNILIQKIIKCTLYRVDRIIVLGNLLRNQFHFLPSLDEKIRVVQNGLSLGLKQEDVTYKHIRDAKNFNLLFLSNMITSKGYLDLLEACYILVNEMQLPIKCDFCGGFRSIIQEKNNDIANEADFRKMIQQKQLERIVYYHGIVVGDRKVKFLRNAHVLILPTYYPSEGQPTCIIEAMAYRIPIIATNFRGIPDEVIDGFNGYLIPAKSPLAIAEAIERLWKDPNVYSFMSENAYSHFIENFTQEAHIKRIIPEITNI